jgi:hypothetical protein
LPSWPHWQPDALSEISRIGSVSDDLYYRAGFRASAVAVRALTDRALRPYDAVLSLVEGPWWATEAGLDHLT